MPPGILFSCAKTLSVLQWSYSYKEVRFMEREKLISLVQALQKGDAQTGGQLYDASMIRRPGSSLLTTTLM